MKHLLSISLIILFSLPMLVSAVEIVPCGGPGQEPCQACHLVQLGQNLMTWFITISASIIALVFTLGGMKMVMSGGSEGVSEAKTMMTNAVVGLIILLSAWLIVDTVLKLVVDDTKLGMWNEIQCVVQPEKVTEEYEEGAPGVATTTLPVAECTNDAALMAKYKGSPVGVVASGVDAMVSCYLADAAVAAAVDSSQIYTVDRSHPRCSLTNGNPVCGACSHSNNSCHYGGGKGQGAMAVDFNAKSDVTETQLYNKLQSRRGVCGGTVAFETNHTHITLPGCR